MGAIGATSTIRGNATSTFGAGLQTTALNITSNSVSSTFANGIVLTGGCIEQNGLCISADSLGGANKALSNLVNVAINTSLLSDTANTDSLGSYVYPWKNIYASSTAYLSYVSSTAMDLGKLTLSTSLLPSGNNTVDIGAFGSAWKNIYASSTAFLASATTTMIEPWANNTYDLGSYGRAWNNIYSSGTLYVGSVSTTGAITLANGSAANPSINFPAGSNSGMFSGGSNNLSFALGGSALLTLNPTGAIAAQHNTHQLGAFGNTWKGVYASSTSYLTTLQAGTVSTTMITALSNNASDIGAYGRAWRNIYASSTAHIDYVSSTMITVLGTTTSTFNAGVSASALNITSATASSTFANGIVLTGGCFEQNGLCITADSLGGANKALSNLESVAINTSLLSDANNTDDLGAYGYAWKNIYASSTAFLASATTTMIEPWANNTYDLGSYGKAWKDIFVSGTVYTSSTLVGSGTAGAPTIAFANDSNSGLYSYGSDAIGFTLGGSVRAVMSGSVLNVPGGISPLASGATLTLVGKDADDAGAIGVKIANDNNLTTEGAKIVAFYSTNNTNVLRSYITWEGGLRRRYPPLMAIMPADFLLMAQPALCPLLLQFIPMVMLLPLVIFTAPVITLQI